VRADADRGSPAVGLDIGQQLEADESLLWRGQAMMEVDSVNVPPRLRWQPRGPAQVLKAQDSPPESAAPRPPAVLAKEVIDGGAEPGGEEIGDRTLAKNVFDLTTPPAKRGGIAGVLLNPLPDLRQKLPGRVPRECAADHDVATLHEGVGLGSVQNLEWWNVMHDASLLARRMD
jgi:hypothetical protein